MSDELDKRISIDPEILGGQPCIKPTRIPVWIILEMLEGGVKIRKILKYYPQINKADILACIRYARKLVQKYRE